MRNWLRFVGSDRSRSQFDPEAGHVEALEPRTMLTGDASVVPSAHMVWRGIPFDVRPDSWVVTFDHALGRDDARARAQQVAGELGLRVDSIDVTARGRFANIRTSSRVTEAAVDAAKSRFSFLRQVEPDYLNQPDLVPNDARYPEQWALNNTGQAEVDSGNGQLRAGVPGADMDAERAWNITTGSDRVVVAVIDTGMDITHPDLRANVYTNPGEIPNNNIDDDGNGFIDDVNGWDFVGGQNGPDNNPADPVDPGHGTSVSGCIGAVGGNGIGVAGTAWNVSLLPLKIGGDGPGGLPLFAILGALEYVTMMKSQFNVNIVCTNNSYGALRPSDFGNIDSAQEIAIQDSTDAGVLFVASAGNDAVDNDSNARAFPASYPNPDIIAVAATTNRDTLASFSNFGRTSVDVGAPGEQVLTTEVGGGYRLINGTSFSGPYTAGVVAMVASVNPFLSKQQIKSAILGSVDVVPGLQGLVLSNGRVNLFRALLAAQFPGPIVTAITPGPQTAPVTQIRVSFSQDIDPAFFNIAGVELRRANGDSRFDSNDIFINLADPNVATVSLTSRQLLITLNAPLSRDLHRLTLRNTFFRDTQGRFLNGSNSGGNDEVYDFNVVAFRGAYEPNDAISQATPVVLDSSGSATLSDITIGDGLFEDRDVDIFRVFATAPALITAQITARGLSFPSSLDSYLRLFDASGVELAANDNFNGLDSKVQFFVPAAGQYYIGVSAFPNRGYNPILENTGVASQSGGTYQLFVQVQANSSDAASRTNTTQANIPSTGTITSTLNFTDGRSILDVNVRLNIQHTFVGDLRISLTGPQGQTVTLVNRRGGAGDDFSNTLFDDEAASSILAGSPPFSGSFRPETPLTSFDQTSAAGTWTLRIEDLKAGDSGRLLSWGLDLTLANDVFGPFEVNDTSLVATDANITGSGSQTFNAFIGDGAFGLRDVDMFRFVAGAGTTITAVAKPTSGTVDLILRLFNADGTEVAADKRKGSTSAAINYVVAVAGTYYLGVSGGNTTSDSDPGNDNYQIGVGGSGNPTDATGAYALTVGVAGGISEGAVVLQGSQLSTGINSNGAIGFATNPPQGSTATGLRLGATDFLLRSAGLMSYFGASVDGFNVLNTADGSESDISVAVANESDYTNRRVAVTGTFRNLGVRRVLSYGVNDRAIAIDVTLTNRSLNGINNLSWMEGFNPDQGDNGVVASTRNTTNNVREGTPRLATATIGSGLTLGLGAADGPGPGVFAGFAPRGTLRDPLQLINNPVDPDPTGDAGVSGDLDMALAFNLGSLGPSQSVHFRYFLFADTSLAGVVSTYGAINGGTSTGNLAADPKQPANDTEGFADLPYRVYYSEGFANSRAQTFLPIVNANAEDIRVVVIARYEKQVINGVDTFYAPDVLYDSATDAAGGRFAPTRRGGITLTRPDLYAAGDAARVQSEVFNQMTSTRRQGVRKDVPYAVEVRASAPVGAILSHYDFGIATGDSFTSQLDTTWLLGAGQKGGGSNDFVTFYNPSSTVVKVTLTAFPAGGGAPVQVFRTVQGHRRGGWAINDIPQIPDGRVSFKVDADVPIVAALSHFNSATHEGFGTLAQPGGGSTTGATGQGAFGLNSSGEMLSVVNAGSSAASVTFTFSFANGSSYRHTMNVGAQRRAELDVSRLNAFPVGQAYAVSYTSNQPVGVNITSRIGSDEEGSVLAPRASTQWLFAEGFRPLTGSAVHETLRLYNPSSQATTVEIVMNYNNGSSEVFRRPLPSRAGVEFNLHDLVTSGNRETVTGVGAFYGVKVQAAVPIVAWAGHFDDFLGGGFGTLGTPLGTTGAAG